MTITLTQLSDFVHQLQNHAQNDTNHDRFRGNITDIQALLSTLPPAELIEAEYQLLTAGLAPTDLYHFCTGHLGLFGDGAALMKQTLPAGHPILTMVQEHDRILDILSELEILNDIFQQQDSIEVGELKLVACIAQQLLNAEPHHQREEQVLFPAVEAQGLFGPSQVMRAEHEVLWARKEALRSLATLGTNLELLELKARLQVTSQLLILSLRDHILKENNILYPVALQTIQDSEIWIQIKQSCDRIGYCPFTPIVS